MAVRIWNVKVLTTEKTTCAGFKHQTVSGNGALLDQDRTLKTASLGSRDLLEEKGKGERRERRRERGWEGGGRKTPTSHKLGVAAHTCNPNRWRQRTSSKSPSAIEN